MTCTQFNFFLLLSMDDGCNCRYPLQSWDGFVWGFVGEDHRSFTTHITAPLPIYVNIKGQLKTEERGNTCQYNASQIKSRIEIISNIYTRFEPPECVPIYISCRAKWQAASDKFMAFSLSFMGEE
jgi:23S rRNA A1618 N6-methylase RlmF